MFIDYDNLLDHHKSRGILAIVTSALMRITASIVPTRRATCEVRIYGGWYEGAVMTNLAQHVAAEVQRDFPALLKTPARSEDVHVINVTGELAFSLLEEPNHHLFATYRRKGMPTNLRVQQPAAVGCTQSACPLLATRKLLKSGRCPEAGCAVTATDLIYRHEQKIVDTMLTCDLIFCAAQQYDRAVLISGDDDFLPSIRTVLLRGTPVTRIHPRPNSPRVRFPHGGATLSTMDL